MSDQISETEQTVERALHMHPGDLKHPAAPLQRGFDAMTAFSANPWIILGFLCFTALYVIVNHFWLHFDQTLLLFTFAVSVLAIFLAQVILNSQGRQAAIESRLAGNSYAQIDATAEIVKRIDSVQDTQLTLLRELRELQDQLSAHIGANPPS